MEPEIPLPQYEAAVDDMFEQAGIQRPEPGRLRRVSTPSRDRRVFDVTTIETTPLGERFTADPPELLPRERFTAAQGNFVECDILPCFITEFFGIDCSYIDREYTSPDIVAEAMPVSIPQATLYVNPFNARIEGEITTEQTNNSTPGFVEETTIDPCSDAEMTSTERRPDSAVLDTLAEETIVVQEVNQTIGDIESAVSGLAPSTAFDTQASFTTRGVGSILYDLGQLFLDGGMRVDANIDLTAGYEWRGTSRTRTFSTTVDMFLPVENVTVGVFEDPNEVDQGDEDGGVNGPGGRRPGDRGPRNGDMPDDDEEEDEELTGPPTGGDEDFFGTAPVTGRFPGGAPSVIEPGTEFSFEVRSSDDEGYNYDIDAELAGAQGRDTISRLTAQYIGPNGSDTYDFTISAAELAGVTDGDYDLEIVVERTFEPGGFLTASVPVTVRT
jgi:hypothetical protein